MDHRQISDVVSKLGAITGMHGLAVVCYIHDTVRDELALLEMNFRPGVGMHFRGPIRRMFVGGIPQLLTGNTYSGSKTPGAENSVIHLFPQDLYRSIGQRDFAGLARLFAGAALQDMPYDDPRLLFAHIRWLPAETFNA